MSDSVSSEATDTDHQEVSVRKLFSDNKYIVLKHTLFLVYLAVLVIVVNNARPSFLSNQFATHLRTRFQLRQNGLLDNSGIALYDLTDERQLWDYVINYMIPGVFEDSLPSGTLKANANEQATVLNMLRRVGAMRIRQLRVRRGTCDVAKRFRPIVDTCVAEFSKDDQSKVAYGPGQMFTYKTQPGEQLFFIQRRYYPGGGFIITTNSSSTAVNQALMNSLKTNRFIDESTRLVDFRFAFYNPYLDSIAICVIAFEFLPSGGFKPFASFRLATLSGFADGRLAAFKITFEALLYCFVIYFIVMQIVCLVKMGWAYFGSGWNWVDMTLICLFIALFILRMISVADLSDFRYSITDSQYTDFSKIELLRVLERRALAFAIWLSFIKIFQLVSWHTKLNQLLNTLEEAAMDIVLFLVIILIVLFGFVFAAQLLFGEVIYEVSQFSTALSFVVRMGLGDSRYEDLEQADFSVGPLYFYVLTFVLAMFLFNVFVAIILGAHEAILDEEEEKAWAGAPPNAMSQALTVITDRIRSCVGLQKKQVRLERDREDLRQAADTNKDGLLDANELNELIKKHPGHAPFLLGIQTTQQIYDAYDDGHVGAMSEEEQRAFFTVLDERRQNIVLMEEIIAMETQLGCAPPTTFTRLLGDDSSSPAVSALTDSGSDSTEGEYFDSA